MEVCSVCVKKSIFPEKYGNVSLCKICSIKILSPASEISDRAKIISKL